MIVLWSFVSLLALMILVYLVMIFVAKRQLAWRARHHIGVYRIDGIEAMFDDEESAKVSATERLVDGDIESPARVMAERTDGGWDVVDEIHLLRE